MVRSAVADEGAVAPDSAEQSEAARRPGTGLAAAASSSTPVLASAAVARAKPGPGETTTPTDGYACRWDAMTGPAGAAARGA
jgi:hypothetical protein